MTTFAKYDKITLIMDIKRTMKIFDSHTHVFPDEIAEKATAGIGGFYEIPIFHSGTTDDLKLQLKDNGICGSMICSVATVLSQVKTINDFIANAVTLSDGVFIGFCSLHPDMSQHEIDDEIERAVSIGLSGIKLHPDFQRFKADGATAYKIYEVIGNRLPVLIHSGDNRYDFSSPKRIATALKRFPDLTMIAAHLGGWSEWDDAALCLAGLENVYVDTSSSLYAMSTDKATEYIRTFGVQRVLFGTDYPMWDIKAELERFDKLNLSDSERELILYQNASALLNLKE